MRYLCYYALESFCNSVNYTVYYCTLPLLFVAETMPMSIMMMPLNVIHFVYNVCMCEKLAYILALAVEFQMM